MLHLRYPVIAALLGIAAAPAVPPSYMDANTTTVGGRGGTSYSIRCKPHEIMYGLRVYSGWWIDRVTPMCAAGTNIMAGGWDFSYTHSVSAGKSHIGNSEKTAACAQGYAVRSFKANAGDYVNSLVITCVKLGKSWRATNTTTALPLVGASGGTSYPARTCSESMPAVGIHGKAGEYVDRFGLICGYILPSRPVLQAPINGLRVSTKRPTFYYKDGPGTADLWNTICINLISTADCSGPNTVKATLDFMTNSWTPTEDLPFNRSEKVYWSVNACNDSGCKSSVGNFYAF